MKNKDIINAIQQYSLTVRCLPHVVISHWTYHEGDEHRKWADSVKRSVVIRPDGKKLLREERAVEKGGWWYVKETPNTDSTVRFSRKYDKFFAPALEKAIQLYLDSKEK